METIIAFIVLGWQYFAGLALILFGAGFAVGFIIGKRK